MQSKNEKLKALVSEQQRQLDTMMHDIRNLLLAQNITVQMLKKAGGKDMKKFKNLIETLEKSILEMKKVIDEAANSKWHTN
ncbi:hypothetical protein ABIE26_005111 [Pedobacter africanus]|uniref:Uncharacterized protein n=1 Tax=Pedobacter africanus TaxID=151894 RepID=A0ACC6L4R9_9SPHI|nr:hypothetical protein [Pedobacter africanus]MDR6786392.1 hypothetical protein [Pedobacter africanus]